jgi:hypothetical protein
MPLAKSMLSKALAASDAGERCVLSSEESHDDVQWAICQALGQLSTRGS